MQARRTAPLYNKIRTVTIGTGMCLSSVMTEVGSRMLALFGESIDQGSFRRERVGTPFPLLKSCQNAWERCYKE